jgi:hypothetical protein
LLAMSFRYQASSVSGFATAANSSKAFRPSRWAAIYRFQEKQLLQVKGSTPIIKIKAGLEGVVAA